MLKMERQSTMAIGRDGEERTEVEISYSTKGVTGFAVTGTNPQGLLSNIMHCRVTTYKRIKMKRYCYTYSRYI